MLKSDCKWLVQAAGGFEDMTEHVTDGSGMNGYNMHARTLAGAKHMWRTPTTSYHDETISGYVMDKNETRFSTIFSGNEAPLWATILPSNRVEAFRAYLPQDGVAEDDGIFTMDMTLESSGGYFSEIMTEAAEVDNISLSADTFIFYYLPVDVTATELDFVVEPAGGGSSIQILDNVTLTAGIYLQSLGLTTDQSAVTLKRAITGSLGANEKVFWAYGRMR